MASDFYLGAYWRNRPGTLREYIADSKRFLSRLRALHPVFQDMTSWELPRGSPVALLPDLSNLDELLLRRASRRDALYTPCDAKGAPTLDSTCQLGFITNYANKTSLADERVGLMVTAGTDTPGLGNAVVIDFPQGVHAFREHEFVRRLLEAVIDCWAPETVVVSTQAFNERLDDQGGRSAIGWMNWFAETAVQEALPEEVACEPLGGGVLVMTARDAVSPDVPEHVANARHIRDSLRTHGVVP